MISSRSELERAEPCAMFERVGLVSAPRRRRRRRRRHRRRRRRRRRRPR